MNLFVASVALVLVMSAFCSLSEAAIYAVRKPYVLNLVQQNSLPGRILADFKDNMERPISAILVINTAANTAGAAIAGYQVKELFGQSALVWFTISFTLAVLMISEIFPKTLGVAYNRPVATAVAVPWAMAIRLLQPFIWIVQILTRVFAPKEPVLSAPEEEVDQLAQMSAAEGSILHIEAKLVRNVLRLDNVKASDILTPRSVVFKLPAEMTIREVNQKVKDWSVSRIPIYAGDDTENWIGMVLAHDIVSCMAKDQFDVKLDSLSRPMYFVPETISGHDLLGQFLRKKSHLFGVLDEYGGIEGVVSLEDVLESVIGAEIVDEYDVTADLQEQARKHHQQREGEQQAADGDTGKN